MSDARPMPPALLWTSEEVAFATALSADAVDREREAGRLTAIKIGRKWRYRPIDVQAWIDGLRPASAPDTSSYYTVNGLNYRTPQAGSRAG
jgi:hypothetical protein